MFSIKHDCISSYSQLYDHKQLNHSAPCLELYLPELCLRVCTARVVQRHNQSIMDTLTSKRNDHLADQLLEPEWRYHTNLFVKRPLVRNMNADQNCDCRVHAAS